MDGDSGEIGGALAARTLTAATYRMLPGIERISVFVYLEFEWPVRKLRDAGIMFLQSRFEGFVRGFTGYSGSDADYHIENVWQPI